MQAALQASLQQQKESAEQALKLASQLEQTKVDAKTAQEMLTTTLTAQIKETESKLAQKADEVEKLVKVKGELDAANAVVQKQVAQI